MILQQISSIITQTVKSQYDLDVSPNVAYAEPQFGDFTTNVAFVLAKELRKSPQAIAEELADVVKNEDVASATAAGSGFINIVMQPKFWLSKLEEMEPGYGRNELGKGQKVQVEFISANPTGPMTLGNARGAYIGDTLCRILDISGYEVTREYYFNDAGTQIRKLVNSVKLSAGVSADEEAEYSGEYVEELAGTLKDRIVQMSDAEIGEHVTAEIRRRYIESAIDKMGIKFDVWFNEKSLVASGELDEALVRLKKAELVYEKEGAVWLASTKLGDERDRVLKKSNGDVTYLGNDIAYHINIFEKRSFDKAIKVWGADHAGQVPSLKLTVEHLLPQKELDFVILQLVRLIKEGREVKMSKRAGTYVTVNELIDDVGSDVARFFFLMRSADNQMDFDLDLAREHTQKNPLFYLLYSYARARSILEKAKDSDLYPAVNMADLTSIEREIVKQMSQFPELVAEVARDHTVHKLPFYGLGLAKLFHDYYEQEKILAMTPQKAQEKLYFIQQYASFIETYAGILGIALQIKM